jgi:hypothetical protein
MADTPVTIPYDARQDEREEPTPMARKTKNATKTVTGPATRASKQGSGRAPISLPNTDPRKSVIEADLLDCRVT